MKKVVDLSIIVTAHNEGIVAHKTMLSIEEAVKELADAGYSYEMLVAIDSGSEETSRYFTQYASTHTVTVLNGTYNDLSSSRNAAVTQCNGQYVTFIDADDLMSHDWLFSAMQMLKDNSNCIAHPEYSITFEDDNLIWRKRNSSTRELDTLCLIDNNLWDSPCMARRDVFQEHPYYPNGNGFGYEDKQFNCETIAAGIPHKVVPDTVLFVRRKQNGSMLRQASGARVTIAPSSLLDFEALQALDLANYAESINAAARPFFPIAAKSKNVVKKIHRQAKKVAIYEQATRQFRVSYNERRSTAELDKYPAAVIDSWRKVHAIENRLFPSSALVKTLPWYNAENIRPGVDYVRLVQSLTRKPNTLFFVPHLIKGGADKVFIQYANELSSVHSDWNIAMFQTEKKTSVWDGKLSESIDFVNMHSIFNELDSSTQHRLLATFVVQNNIERIVICNAQLAYEFVEQYKVLLSSRNVTIYCFAFGEEFDDEGRLWGHIHTGIPRVYQSLYRIITDNHTTVAKLSHEYAFNPNRFAVHYQPTDLTIHEPVVRDGKTLKILWASRVCKQKRPDILKRVSMQLDKNRYEVDAYGQLEEGLTEAYFADSQVSYKGAFDGISTLPVSDYDIFLYTSEGDGIPNILQEITAIGLPIVASNVGGIHEFIHDGTGVLVKDHNDIQEYVDAIHSLNSVSKRKHAVNGAQDFLRSNFSINDWKNNVRETFDR